MDQIIISETLFRDNSPIPESTDIAKFVPYINIAQKMHIERILGRPLTDTLKTQVADDTLTPANAALIKKIAPALTMYAIYQGIPFNWALLANKGFTLRSSENSQSVGIDDLATVRRWIKNDAEFLAKDLIAYLCECKDQYPEWRPEKGCGCEGDGEGSARPEHDAGIFIPERPRSPRY